MSEIRTLLPPSTTATLRALETVMAETEAGIETPIPTLWNADTCPEHLLPWLAWSFSVEVWEHDWTEATKRAVIREAIAVHRLKGTRGAVERALGALDFAADISEWFEYGGAPHTFRVDAYSDDIFEAGFGIDAALVETITRLIENVKPVRSHFSLRFGERFASHQPVRSGCRMWIRDTETHALQSEIAATSKAHCRAGMQVRFLDQARHELSNENGEF